MSIAAYIEASQKFLLDLMTLNAKAGKDLEYAQHHHAAAVANVQLPDRSSAVAQALTIPINAQLVLQRIEELHRLLESFRQVSWSGDYTSENYAQEFGKVHWAIDALKPYSAMSSVSLPAISTPAESVDTPEAILCHDERVFSVPGSTPFTVTEKEDAVLRVFLDKPVVDSEILQSFSGNQRAPEVLRRLTSKYERRLAPFITLPGGKGKGGYSVLIRRAPTPP